MDNIKILYVGNNEKLEHQAEPKQQETGQYSEPEQYPKAKRHAESEQYQEAEQGLKPERVQVLFWKENTPLPCNQKPDLVLLDRDVSEPEIELLKRITRGYCLFATERADLRQPAVRTFYEGKMGKRLQRSEVPTFLKSEAWKYFSGSYGERFLPDMLMVNSQFQGEKKCLGNDDLCLKGNFGDEFRQIVYWKYNIPLQAHQVLDLYLEYEKRGTVEICLKAVFFYGGSADGIKHIQTFDEDEVKKGVQLKGDAQFGTVFVSILAKGVGSLEVFSLHNRYSRDDAGYFVPGGKRLVTAKGEEVFTYFEKGNAKPPLVVYFSGYRKQEGFEGYALMQKFDCPFLLVTDPRSEGGGCYIGEEAYEQMLLEELKSKIYHLGFSLKDVIFVGASMGTYGALYYGSAIPPRVMLLAKPLANMGTVAKNERMLRTEGFGTSLDFLRKYYHSLGDEAIKHFNRRLWARFDKAQWSETKFKISYLYEDDYDPSAYRDILSHLKGCDTQVYGKGNHGRHKDNQVAVMKWLESQLNKLVREDFHYGT